MSRPKEWFPLALRLVRATRPAYDLDLQSFERFVEAVEAIDTTTPLKDKLLSCVCLLEVMADNAKERDDTVEWAMMSVMAKDGRKVLDGYQSE